MSTHDESSGSRFSGGGEHYNAEGQDPVNLFAESGYGSSTSSSSGAGASSSLSSAPEESSALDRDPSSFDFPDYGDQKTSLMANVGEPVSRLDDGQLSDTRRLGNTWHGGADFGLLVLRVVVGGLVGMYGLQHLFHLFHGTGIDAFAKFLQTAGYHYPTIMAWVGGGAELVGGALLVLGLFTPAAAGAVLAVLANVIVLKWPVGFWAANGYQFQFVLAAGAFALLFAGPGRVSLDRPTPWYRHPVANAWTFLIIAAAASVAVLLFLRTH